MKIKELQSFIQKLSPDLYSFAYVLIPDDLQATQLIIDSVQSFLIQKTLLTDKLLHAKNNESQVALLDEARLQLQKILFELAKKRYQQLKVSFQDVESEIGFFSLVFEEKAVLFLKEKVGHDLDSVGLVTGLSQSEILSNLYTARLRMGEQFPVQGIDSSAASGAI
jgi:hypothetical protein